MQIQRKFIVTADLKGLRLDHALAQLLPEYSRARLQAWVREGDVTVNGKSVRPRDKVNENQEIVINATIAPQEIWQPQAITLDIIYEDSSILVINKPIGLVVHPGAGVKDSTLLNALLHHAPELNKIPRAGIVHRLDKDTSGLLVIAKTLMAHKNLIEQIQKRTMKREYQAIVNGLLISGGTISEPIGRHPTQRTKMAVIESGKPAITHYRIMEKFRAHTHIKIQLETGRTHQIRVHMAFIHHPIVGDQVYGGRLKLPQGINETLKNALQNFKHQALHASRLELEYPESRKLMHWEAPLPKDMRQLLKLLHEDKH